MQTALVKPEKDDAFSSDAAPEAAPTDDLVGAAALFFMDSTSVSPSPPVSLIFSSQ